MPVSTPTSEPEPEVETTRPCRDCAEEVEIGAMFCGNCGVRWPHGEPEPAVTGNTVRQAAPPEPAKDEGGFEWDEDQTVDGSGPALVEPLVGSMRRGKGAPGAVPADPTQPRTVKSGLPSLPKPEAKEPQDLGGGVASLIADELDEPPTEPRRMVGDVLEPIEDDDASEPLELEPEVDAAVAQASGNDVPSWANLTEEIAEIQFSILQGFEEEAKQAFAPLAAAHPGHPELAALAEELGVSAAAAASTPEQNADEDVDEFDVEIDITAARMRAPTGPGAASDKPEITVVTKGPQPARPYASAAPTGLPPEADTSPTFVEGTAPPTGGFVQRRPATPASVQPQTTPSLGLAKASGRYPASSDSMPTNPRGAQPVPETTVVTAKPSAPAPYQGTPPQDVGPAETVRLVMLGSRGQSLHEVLLRPGERFDVGRDPQKPWGDDDELELQHARFTPAPGGGVLVEPLGQRGVFRQVDERLVVRDGDEFRVGQSIVRYRAGTGWGELDCLPMGREPAMTLSLGGSGALVGRENADVEIPDDTYVSGAHCQFSCRGDALYIEDLGSANGTYTRVRATEAVPYGALLLLGQTQFKIRPVTSRRPASR